MRRLVKTRTQIIRQRWRSATRPAPHHGVREPLGQKQRMPKDLAGHHEKPHNIPPQPKTPAGSASQPTRIKARQQPPVDQTERPNTASTQPTLEVHDHRYQMDSEHEFNSTQLQPQGQRHLWRFLKIEDEHSCFLIPKG